MSTQPSEHAIAHAVAELQQKLDVAHATGTRFATQLADANRRVAERDKRIAELVDGFLRIASMTMSHVATAQDGFTRCREIADEMLARHGGAHE